MPGDVISYLSEQISKSEGECTELWAKLEQLYTKRLWHQLTLAVLDFISHPIFSSGNELVKMYENFIFDFEHRISPVALVQIVRVVLKQCTSHTDALTLLEKIQKRVGSNDEATIMCLTSIAYIKLNNKDMDQVKTMIADIGERLEKLGGVSSVHSLFFQLSSEYHKLMGNHAAYYRDALRLLGCINLNDLSDEEKKDRAFHLGLAALLDKDIYNFGELLQHPILTYLDNSSQQWLKDLLFAANCGNLTAFHDLKPVWSKQADLLQNETTILKKITLISLMEMTFRTSSRNRQLTFEDISKEAQISVDEVELFVMKALSLGLIKGAIDQVDQKVHVSWVQPRILNIDQIKVLQSKVEEWVKKVTNLEKMVEEEAKPILA